MIITDSTIFAERMGSIPESFIREILKVSTQHGMISFAGGLPNPEFFPAEKVALAAEKVLRKDGKAVLQYAPTEGYLPLRDFIAQRQSKQEGIKITADDVLILNGAQQGLDLSGKLFIDKHTGILLEGPSYLGAIQSFSVFQPAILEVEISDGGPDLNAFRNIVKNLKPAFFYCIPNFQNPTGNTYDELHRQEVTSALQGTNTILIEDNPYGEINFLNDELASFHARMPEQTLYLGSFSKVVSPGLRLGWAVANKDIIRKMNIAKQASDLHSNNFAQRVLYQFLLDNDLDSHLSSIKKFYHSQAQEMLRLIELYFPKETNLIIPTGGMFIWATLPDRIKSAELLKLAVERQVLFVPGQYFYTQKGMGENSMRLNFSNPSKAEMERGIKILGQLIREQEAIG